MSKENIDKETQTETASQVDALVRQQFKSKLTTYGKFIYYSRMARFWKDGDTASFLWNWWNPLTILLIVILFIPIILAYGFTGLQEVPGIKMSRYWKEHKDERVFF